MTELQDILSQIPVDQIAGMLGTDRQTAQAAVEAAVPTLLAGMHSNAQASDGAASLESALNQHQNGLIEGGVDVSQVDTADGEKIVSHVFGGQQDQVVSQLAGTSQLGGVGGDMIKKLLPILAPIVMSYLAKKVLGGRGQTPGAGGAAGSAGTGASGQAGGIDLGGILGGILGGVGGAAAGGAGGMGGLGDLLGGLLGGGQPSSPAAVPDAVPAAGRNSPLEPQAYPQGQPTGGAPRPGEVIDVDLPESQPVERKNDDGGFGGILGGLFGKK
ncbi:MULTISPECIES: DUF937 domain-containing protein [unclassified Arthrobacter]|uniref:DUF937 domain-containing protein n=1 Tax=unclassified Arthrobacter TaxID=235627 RepID=UPI002DFFDEA1|nr:MULTISPECIES: DUF937 domain-containing protein [unclassified Arthrobacter]MEC5190554.1 hypothetical protein [Arthrobacter sp. MP_M4]MEC5201905.1 hypothetical protein [Arthrobacter sp. MP_M7]